MKRLAPRALTTMSAALGCALLFGGAAQSQMQQPSAVERMGPAGGSTALGSRSDEQVSPELYLTRNDIRKIQQALADKGEDVGGIDGAWGAKTQTAVRRFQEKRRIGKADGELDRETIQALGVELSDPVVTSGSVGTAGTSTGSSGAAGSAGAGTGDRGLSATGRPLDGGSNAPLGTGTGVSGVEPRGAATAGRPSTGTGGSPGTSGPVGTGAAGLPSNVGSPGTDAGSGTVPPNAGSGSAASSGGSLGGGGSSGGSR